METETLPINFTSRSLAASIYRQLILGLQQLSSWSVEEKKASLHLVAGRGAFLGVHPKASGLHLNIVTATPLKSERVAKTEQVSANRFHNTVKLSSPEQVDSELIGWITSAWERMTH